VLRVTSHKTIFLLFTTMKISNLTYGHHLLHKYHFKEFNVHGSVHRDYSNINPTRCNVTQFILSGNCSTCFGWRYHPKHVCQIPDAVDTVVCAPDDEWRYHPKHVCQIPDAVDTVVCAPDDGWRYHPKHVCQIPDAVDTVVCAPDDGWRYHPKHVEQFPDKINCVTLHPVGYILGYEFTVLTALIVHTRYSNWYTLQQ
jgi:hypothetical protein